MDEFDNQSEVLLEPDQQTQDELNWFQRTFSKMDKDSLRGSIFMMLLTALGTGIFTLHHLFDEIGILFAFILITLVGSCFYLSSDMLIYALKYAPKSHSISDMNKTILGNMGFIIYNILMFVYIMLCLIASMTSISRIFFLNFENIIWKIFTVEDSHKNFHFFNTYFAYVVGFLLFFLVVQREIESLRYFTLYSFFIFVFIILIFLFQAKIYIEDLVEHDEAKYNIYNITAHGLFSSFGCLLFAYNAIVNFYTVVGTVNKPTTKRLRKIFMRTFAILAVAFMVVGTIAYLSLGKVKTPSVDLFIFREKLGNSDIIMIIGRCLIIVSLCVGCGINAYPLKVMLRQALSLENSFKTNLIMSITLVAACTIIVSLFTEVTDYVSFAGSFCATIMVFVYPSIIALKTGYCTKTWSKLLLIGFVTLLTGLGMASTYVSLTNFFKKK